LGSLRGTSKAYGCAHGRKKLKIENPDFAVKGQVLIELKKNLN
jgi:hypothetical protein